MIEILAQIRGPNFTAGIVLHDDVVVETAPIVRRMRRWSRDQVRDYCKRLGWTVSVVRETEREPIAPIAHTPGIVQHEESFEVLFADGRVEFVYFDDNPGRRAISGRLSKEKAFVRAQEMLAPAKQSK